MRTHDSREAFVAAIVVEPSPCQQDMTFAYEWVQTKGPTVVIPEQSRVNYFFALPKNFFQAGERYGFSCRVYLVESPGSENTVTLTVNVDPLPIVSTIKDGNRLVGVSSGLELRPNVLNLLTSASADPVVVEWSCYLLATYENCFSPAAMAEHFPTGTLNPLHTTTRMTRRAHS